MLDWRFNCQMVQMCTSVKCQMCRSTAVNACLKQWARTEAHPTTESQGPPAPLIRHLPLAAYADAEQCSTPSLICPFASQLGILCRTPLLLTTQLGFVKWHKSKSSTFIFHTKAANPLKMNAVLDSLGFSELLRMNKRQVLHHLLPYLPL